MIDVQTLNVVGFVSQMTFALTIALLAWSDRRSRGMAWLAAASAAQLLTTFSRYIAPNDSHGIMRAMACGLMVLLYFFAYKGLHWFVVRHTSSPFSYASFISVATAVVFIVALKSPSAAIFISRMIVLLTTVVTISLLWRTRETSLRLAARICALQLAVVMSVVLFRVYADALRAGPMQAKLSTYGREAALLSVILLFLSFIGVFVAEGKRRFQVETRTDALTGLSNRRAMEEFADEAILFSRQHHLPLAFLMLDLDHFKLVNDTWGHLQGDRALRALSAVLQGGIRSCDFVARLGGEEFAILLPGQDVTSASAVAERLRASIEDLSVDVEECCASVTVSIGVSTLREEEATWAPMLRRADKALYRAKREGRNRVIQHSDELAVLSVEPKEMDRRTGTNG